MNFYRIIFQCVNKDLKKSFDIRKLEKYDEIFKEYDQNKNIEKVPKKPVQVHYLSHRLREDKEGKVKKPPKDKGREDKDTTKIRAVFDASCVLDGSALNDCLYPGPNLLSKIFHILLRFQFNFTAILADIKQAFFNVEISKDHRDFLRFPWYENVNSESVAKLIVYRFLTVVFGVTSSTFF